MEFVERFNLQPELAYTPALNDAMLDHVMQENMDGGMNKDKAMKERKLAERDIKELLARNGLL